MNIQKEISEAINKQLPAEVGDVLKARLEQADKDRDALELLDGVLKGLEVRVEELSTSNVKLTKKAQEVEGKEKLNIKKEEELAKRELELDKTIAVSKQENAEKITDKMEDLVKIVFKSPVYRKEMTSNEYNGQSNQSLSSNSTERIVEEN